MLANNPKKKHGFLKHWIVFNKKRRAEQRKEAKQTMYKTAFIKEHTSWCSYSISYRNVAYFIVLDRIVLLVHHRKLITSCVPVFSSSVLFIIKWAYYHLYFLITSSFSFSARCFLFCSFFFSSMEISWKTGSVSERFKIGRHSVCVCFHADSARTGCDNYPSCWVSAVC